LEAIASASRRIHTNSLRPEDFCLGLGVEPSSDGTELEWRKREALARLA
jgi:hypothetical protein